jgi:hypothetical protein
VVVKLERLSTDDEAMMREGLRVRKAGLPRSLKIRLLLIDQE